MKPFRAMSLLLLAALALLRPLSLVAAQEQQQQPVRGSVVDPTGVPVAGAKVVLQDASSGQKLETASDPGGLFAFPGVAAGAYRLSASTEDLESSAKEVAVDAAPVEMKLKLKVRETKETVTVAAQSSKVLEESISAERNADRLNFEDAFLDALPAPGQNALGVVTNFLSPAAQGSEGASIVIDGVESGASALPASSIRRIRVNRNPYALQFRRPGKARVDVYTEEGSMRRYRGAFGVAVRNSVFDARNAFAATRPPLSRALLDFNFSGPIRRDRSSYYINVEHYRDNEYAVVNALTLAGPFVANVATPEHRTRLLGRWENRGEIHQITAQYSLLDQSESNRGTGGLKLPEQGVPDRTRVHRWQFSDRALLGGRILNDLRLVGQHEENERGALAGAPVVQVNGAFTGGPSAAWRERRETAVRIQDIASVTQGRHNLKVGAEARPAHFDSREQSNFAGTYEFSGLEAYAAARPLLYRINQGDPRVRFNQHEAFGFIQDETAIAKRLNVTYGVRYAWQSGLDHHRNIAPRVGFAYAPTLTTVIRGGAGVFHERVTEDLQRRSLLWDGARLRESIFYAPSFPLTAGSAGVLPPPSIVRRFDLRAPVLQQASLAVEQQVGKRNTLSLEYQVLRGAHLLRSRNVNAPGAFGIRPAPDYLAIQQVESTGSLRSRSLSATLRGAWGKRFSGLAQYAYSHSDDDTFGPFEYPADSRGLAGEWGRSAFDRRHRFTSAAMADFARSGIRIGAFVTLASGAPYNITTGRDDNGDTIVNDRPLGIARNTGLGPGLAQVDLRFTRLFRAPRFLDTKRKSGAAGAGKKGSPNVELSVDAFNLFNRVNFAGFVGVETSPFFGRANSALTPRTIQLSLRYKL